MPDDVADDLGSKARNGQGKGSCFGSGGQEGNLWKGNVGPDAGVRGSDCCTWCVWGTAGRPRPAGTEECRALGGSLGRER